MRTLLVCVALVAGVAAAVGVAERQRAGAAAGDPASCIVQRVIDGDTFVCDDDTRVRMLQINTPEKDACGGPWATAALANIFLRPGTRVRLEYDEVREDRYGRTLAAPVVVGTDGADYNISIVMVYVGLAKAAYYGDNSRYLEWARAAEAWAKTAEWNMWAPGGPYNGAAWCGPGDQ